MVIRVVTLGHVDRVRVIYRFEVFKDSYVGTFRYQGGARFFATYACRRVLFLRVSRQVRRGSYGLRIKRARGLDLARRVNQSVLCFVVNERLDLVIGGVFGFARRPQVSLYRFIGALCNVAFLRDLDRYRSARVYQIEGFLIRVLGICIVIASGPVRTLSSRARPFLSGLFGQASS